MVGSVGGPVLTSLGFAFRLSDGSFSCRVIRLSWSLILACIFISTAVLFDLHLTMDGADLFCTDPSEAEGDFEDWSVVLDAVSPTYRIQNSSSVSLQPSCKSAPLPAPAYRHDLSVSRIQSRAPISLQFGGLAAPSHPQPSFASQVERSTGLQSPDVQGSIPRSLQLQHDMPGTINLEDSVEVMLPPVKARKLSSRTGVTKFPPGPGSSDITRVRQASNSPLVMSLWNSVISLFTAFSPLLEQLQTSAYRTQHYERLVNNFAASTLIKYCSALQNFHSLLVDLRLQLEGLTEMNLADILVAGHLSRHSSESTSSVSMMIKALRWGYKQLQIQPFGVAFGSLLNSFQTKIPHDRRESLPFSLYVLSQFERHILARETSQDEILILGAFLLLLFSGLRFADLQRTAPTSLQWDGAILRGLAWRTKTSSAGTPFGAVAAGFMSIGTYNWLYKFLITLDEVLTKYGSADIDFLLPSIGPSGLRVPLQPMSYAEGLYFLRRFLSLPWKQKPLSVGTSPSSYTIHGLKSTLISWATQLDLSDEHKRLQGKHQARNSSTRLYSRDDVHGAIKLQQTIIQAIHGGWRPVTPLSRGGQIPLVEPDFALERYNKTAPDHSWGFLQFHGQSFDLPEQGPALPAAEIDEVEASSSSDSGESDSSSSSSASKPPAKSIRTTEVEIADEVVGALHRNTWHVMISQFMRCDREVIQTACGRHFEVTKLLAVQELQLSGTQSLCGHPGCRKGWNAVGA